MILFRQFLIFVRAFFWQSRGLLTRSFTKALDAPFHSCLLDFSRSLGSARRSHSVGVTRTRLWKVDMQMEFHLNGGGAWFMVVGDVALGHTKLEISQSIPETHLEHCSTLANLRCGPISNHAIVVTCNKAVEIILLIDNPSRAPQSSANRALERFQGSKSK